MLYLCNNFSIDRGNSRSVEDLSLDLRYFGINTSNLMFITQNFCFVQRNLGVSLDQSIFFFFKLL